MVKNYWTFGTAGQLVFGRGCLQQISDIARRYQWQRVLIVTDTNIEAAGLVERVCAPLVEAACEIDVFTAGEAEPSIATAVKSLAFAKECAPDVVIGLGGGSNMDLSKNTAAALTHAMKPQDCFGFDNVPGPIMPLVCIPTTAGTGRASTLGQILHSWILR
jgi:alcohol dehydrogenase class IV